MGEAGVGRSEKEQKTPAFNLEMRSLTNETVAVFHLSFSLFAGVPPPP